MGAGTNVEYIHAVILQTKLTFSNLYEIFFLQKWLGENWSQMKEAVNQPPLIHIYMYVYV